MKHGASYPLSTTTTTTTTGMKTHVWTFKITYTNFFQKRSLNISDVAPTMAVCIDNITDFINQWGCELQLQSNHQPFFGNSSLGIYSISVFSSPPLIKKYIFPLTPFNIFLQICCCNMSGTIAINFNLR